MKYFRCQGSSSAFLKFSHPNIYRAGAIACLSLFPAMLAAQSSPQASVASTLLFETTRYGTDTTLPLAITNTGGSALTIATSINGPSFQIVSASPSGCMEGTPGGQVCTLTVEFKPVRVGYHADNLTLQTNGSSNPVVQLQGTAKGAGPILESPLDFGTIPVGTTKTLQVLLENVETSTVDTFTVSTNGPSFKVLTTSPSNSCPLTGQGIKHGESCLLPIEFSPTAAGDHGDVLTITPSTGAPTEIQLKGILQGNSTTSPVAGNIYIADAGNSRVQIFNPDGVYQGQFSSANFDYLSSLAVNSTNIFVNSSENACIVNAFDGTGISAFQFNPCAGTYETEQGSIAVDASGGLWIANEGGFIQHFDGSGNLLSVFCTSLLAEENQPGCTLASGLGSLGIYPESIALDHSGNIYVTSMILLPSTLVAKFDKTGKFLFSFGSAGSGDGQLSPSFGIAVASNGDIYVADTFNSRIEIFDASGNYSGQFGKSGKSETDLTSPQGLAFDSAGNLYIADFGNDRIVKYDSHMAYVSQFGNRGSGNGQFFGPLAVTVAR